MVDRIQNLKPIEMAVLHRQLSGALKQQLQELLALSPEQAEQALNRWTQFCVELQEELDSKAKTAKKSRKKPVRDINKKRAAGKKVTKTDVILSFPPDTPARTIVAHASKMGLEVTSKMVYSVRSANKQKGKKKPAKATKVQREGARQVALGKRPPLRASIVRVMGKKAMKAKEVLELLKKRGWSPQGKDPQGAVLYMLNKHPTTFERVDRGVYKVKKGVTAKAIEKKTKKTTPKRSTAKKSTKARAQA